MYMHFQIATETSLKQKQKQTYQKGYPVTGSDRICLAERH